MTKKIIIAALKREYSLKYFGILVFIIIAFFMPVIAISNQVEFDPAEFANIYLSTIFTSVLIALTLQLIETLRVAIVGYRNIYSHVDIMIEHVNKIKTKLSDRTFEIHNSDADILEHYRISIINFLVTHNYLNEDLISLYNNEEIRYIVETLNRKRRLIGREETILKDKIDMLSAALNTFKNKL